MKQYFFFILIGVISLTSCDNTMIYGEDVDIKDHVWHKDSILSFESDSLLDLPQVLKIGVTVRNTVDYKYRNLWLFVDQHVPAEMLILGYYMRLRNLDSSQLL